MAYLFYARLIGLTAGTLVYLFFIALILGHRRPRLFERILFFLVLSLFLIYAGGLLQMNAEIEYGAAPLAAHLFSEGLAALGFLSLPALVWHAHYAYRRQIRRSQPSAFAKPLLVLLYLAAFAEVVFGISPSWVGSLGGGARLSAVLDNFLLVAGTSLYFVAFMDTVFEFQDWRAAKNKKERELFLALFGVSLVLTILLGLSGGTRLSGSSRGEALGAAIVWIALLPGALLIYFALKHNFLEYGAQRNLVYALSATFLALLYLAFVRRVSGWLEPALPPEATASILLFVLIFLFEPLERVIGPVLHRRFQERVGRLQQLSTEFQTEARNGDVAELAAFAERRIREEFGLGAVRISVPRDPALAPLESPGGLGHVARLALMKNGSEIGLLEAATTGSYLTGETSAALEFLAEQLPGSIDLCRMIGEKLQLERELAERERMAGLGQMAATISHNLRNPLSSMKTVLQVQLENPDLPLDARRDCTLVVSEIDRMSAKLTQLLRYAKPSVNGDRVAAVALARQTASLFGRDAERRNIRMEFDQPRGEIFVRASEDSLGEVLSNLIVNAMEAQPNGGRVRVGLSSDAERAEIRVDDDGPGISEELRARIFQPYFTTKPTGTGLGLSIVARRIAEMGGTLECESPLGNGTGTRFRMTVPLAEEGG
ncbi:MAG TPA: ATP-binding protein [Candidatus Acidoferrales bacterium]|nr:ATP-binding protein [Candidatus Acidoferrales bacterium]